VQSALRVLGNDELIQVPPAARRRSDKWDYDLNRALRVAIDIECLAQLVHAIVLHEEIAVSPGLAGGASWQPGDGARYGADGLTDVIKVIACEESRQRELLVSSAEQALEASRLADFRHYLRALSSGGLEGVVLDISNGYFETGYSDSSSLAAFELEKSDDGFRDADDAGAFYFRIAEEELTKSRLLVHKIKDAPDWGASEALLAESDARLKLAWRFSSVGSQLRSIDHRDHALVESRIPRGYGHEKMTAAYDVVRNLAAALYFQYLADLSGTPYLPHALRAPLAVFDPDRTAAPNLEDRVVAHVQALRRERISAIADTIGPGGFDLEVPLVLARVLRDARSPAEVIPRALELRDSAPAVALRGWFRDLHALMRTADADLRSAERELAGFRGLVARWGGGPAGDQDPSITVGITLGVVNLSGPVRISPGNARRRWRLRFLYDLARTGDSVPRFGPVLARSLGKPTARAWLRAHDTIERYTRQHGSPGRRDSILDLRKGKRR
jgi:hypothetical protein